MITITKITKFKYCFKSNDTEEIDVIKEILSYQKPGYQYSLLFQNGEWDGRNKFYNGDKFYAGLVKELSDGLKLKNIEFRVIDTIPLRLIRNFKLQEERLRIHQKSALNKFFLYNYGIIKIPTRGGKTILSAEAMRVIREAYGKNIPIMFFVDGVELFDQALDDISGYLNIEKSEIGTINDKGIKIVDGINIAMIQTVQSIFDTKKKVKMKEKMKLLLKFFKRVVFLIVDEMHEYSSDQRMRVLKKFENVDFLMGLSATPFKASNVIGNIKLKGFFHDILYDVPEKELKKNKYLANDKFVLVSIAHSLSKIDNRRIKDLDGIYKYQAYQKAVIYSNKLRDRILSDLILLCDGLGFKTLVLFSSKEHGREISRITGYKFISGDDKKEARKAERLEFLKDKGKVLMASNIYKKGITLPEVEILVNADGGLEESLVIQKRGRVLGTTETKSLALIIDMLDIFDEYFSEHSLTRLETYEKLVGKKFIDIIDGDQMGYLELVKNSILNWFNGTKPEAV